MGTVHSASFCDRMATVFTTAHHFIWRYLYASMQAAQTPSSKLMVASPDKGSSLNISWQQDKFEQICSTELLTEKALES